MIIHSVRLQQGVGTVSGHSYKALAVPEASVISVGGRGRFGVGTLPEACLNEWNGWSWSH